MSTPTAPPPLLDSADAPSELTPAELIVEKLWVTNKMINVTEHQITLHTLRLFNQLVSQIPLSPSLLAAAPDRAAFLRNQFGGFHFAFQEGRQLGARWVVLSEADAYVTREAWSNLGQSIADAEAANKANILIPLLRVVDTPPAGSSGVTWQLQSSALQDSTLLADVKSRTARVSVIVALRSDNSGLFKSLAFQAAAAVAKQWGGDAEAANAAVGDVPYHSMTMSHLVRYLVEQKRTATACVPMDLDVEVHAANETINDACPVFFQLGKYPLPPRDVSAEEFRAEGRRLNAAFLRQMASKALEPPKDAS